MSDVFKPTENQGARSDVADAFAKMFQGFAGQPGSYGGLANQFQLPGYGGPLATGVTGQEQGILGLTGDVLSRYFGGGQSLNWQGGQGYGGGGYQQYPMQWPWVAPSQPVQDPNNPTRNPDGTIPITHWTPGMPGRPGLENMMADPGMMGAMAQMFGGGPGFGGGRPGGPYSPPSGFPGSGPGSPGPTGWTPTSGPSTPFIPNGGDLINSIMSIASGRNPAQQALFASAATPNSVTSAISRLLGQENFSGGANRTLNTAADLTTSLGGLPAVQSLLSGQGGTETFNNLIKSLNDQRKLNLQDSSRDLREQYSASGLRFGTDYGQALARLDQGSEADFMAEVAKAIPTLTGQNIQGQESALNFLGTLPQTLSGIGTASGQLGLGGQGNIIQALLGAGNLGLGAGGQTTDALSKFISGQTAGAGQATATTDIISKLPLDLQEKMQGLSAGDLDMLSKAFGLSDQSRQIQDQTMAKNYQEFLRQQQGFTQVGNWMAGAAAPDFSPGIFSQLLNTGGQLGAGALAARALK